MRPEERQTIIKASPLLTPIIVGSMVAYLAIVLTASAVASILTATYVFKFLVAGLASAYHGGFGLRW